MLCFIDGKGGEVRAQVWYNMVQSQPDEVAHDGTCTGIGATVRPTAPEGARKLWTTCQAPLLPRGSCHVNFAGMSVDLSMLNM